MQYTAIPYYYRDQNNYSASSTIFLEGKLSDEQVEKIESKLDGGEFFIPHDLNSGIPEIQDRLWTFPSKSDHVWHILALDEIETVSKLSDGAKAIPVPDFVRAFDQIKDSNSWDVKGASLRLGFEKPKAKTARMRP